MFELRNDVPPAPKIAGKEKETQRVMFSGLDCLPGQGDLFPTDGPVEDDLSAGELIKLASAKGYQFGRTDAGQFRLVFFEGHKQVERRFDVSYAEFVRIVQELQPRRKEV